MSYQDNQFFEQSIPLSETLSKKGNTDFLNDYRAAQRQILQSSQFPNQKVEHFKYSRLSNLNQQISGALSQKSQDIVSAKLLAENEIQAIETQLVFVNGVYDSELSANEQPIVTHFENADRVQQEKIVTMLAQQDLSYNPFVAINGALSGEGVLIEADKASPQTIEIINLLTDSEQADNSAVQLLVDIAEGAELSVITRTISSNESQKNNHLSTFRLVSNIAKTATLNHYYLHFDSSENAHFDLLEYNLDEKSELNAFFASTGSHIKKLDIIVNHNASYANANLNGIYMGEGNQQIDYHTIINHYVAHGTTNEVFRGIAYDKSETVFNGRIFIEEDAQKTLAELNNRNLIMSDDAIMHTKPELEIYADDVICAHGATVSRVDDQSIYYLKARGIDDQTAEMMLSRAFVNELLMELSIPELADYIFPILFKRFDA